MERERERDFVQHIRLLLQFLRHILSKLFPHTAGRNHEPGSLQETRSGCAPANRLNLHLALSRVNRCVPVNWCKTLQSKAHRFRAIRKCLASKPLLSCVGSVVPSDREAPKIANNRQAMLRRDPRSRDSEFLLHIAGRNREPGTGQHMDDPNQMSWAGCQV